MYAGAYRTNRSRTHRMKCDSQPFALAVEPSSHDWRRQPLQPGGQIIANDRREITTRRHIENALHFFGRPAHTHRHLCHFSLLVDVIETASRPSRCLHATIEQFTDTLLARARLCVNADNASAHSRAHFSGLAPRKSSRGAY